jgi:hypothetical protein
LKKARFVALILMKRSEIRVTCLTTRIALLYRLYLLAQLNIRLEAVMDHSEFKIGAEFMTNSGRWRCTDVGTRTIAAIRLDLDHDPTWYSGPPYPIVEHVFDEDGMEDCDPAPAERVFDDSGRARIVVVPRSAPAKNPE